MNVVESSGFIINILRSNKKTMKLVRIASFFVCILILIGLLLYVNPLSVIKVVRNADLKLVLLAFLLANFVVALRVLKWKVLLDNVSFKRLFPIQLLGISISNITPGKIAEPIKSVLLKVAENIPVSQSLPTVLWERIVDLLVLVILGSVGIVILSKFFTYGVVGIVIFSAIILVLVLVLSSRKVGIYFLRISKRVPLLNKISDRFIETFYTSKVPLKKLIICFLITFITWFMEGTIFYIILLSLGLEINLSYALIFPCLFSLSIIIGISSFLPGGLGTTEVVFTLILTHLGFEKTIATSSILLGRFITFGYGMFLGYISFILLSKEFKNVKSLLKDIF